MPDIQVYYATNRNVVQEEPTPLFGELFNAKGPHYIRYGIATVTASGGPASRKYKVRSVELAPEYIPADASDEEQAKELLGSNAVFEALRARMVKGSLDSLCLIHGYASDFDNAILRGAELADKWSSKEKPLAIFVFSWPANGQMKPFIDYHSDRTDAQISGIAMARTFLRLRDFLIKAGRDAHCHQSIHLCAHSMGNWALRHAVQAIKQELAAKSELGPHLPRLLDDVFLMAADEDNDTFEHEHKLAPLAEMSKAVHVYFSEDDKALLISDRTKRNPDRLGTTGPRVRANLPRKIDLVDCSRVDVVPPQDDSIDEFSRYLSQHQYYRLRQEVIDDVKQVLAGLKPADIKGRDFLPADLSYQLVPKAPPKRPAAKKNPGGPRR